MDLCLDPINYLIDLVVRKINAQQLFNGSYRILHKIVPQLLVAFDFVNQLFYALFHIHDLFTEIPVQQALEAAAVTRLVLGHFISHFASLVTVKPYNTSI